MNKINNLFFNILLIFLGKEMRLMMAMLFAQKIILGKATFDQVPNKLKAQVAEILIECGCEDLITDPAYLPNED